MRDSFDFNNAAPQQYKVETVLPSVWGPCAPNCPGSGGLAGGIPQSYYDCQTMCAGLSGQEWADCMNKCFVILCEQGQHEFCQL